MSHRLDNAFAGAQGVSPLEVRGNLASGALGTITVNGVVVFVNGMNFDALNVPLAPGTNSVTAVIQDLTGATNTASINIIGTTNSDGTMNDPVQLSATPVAGFVPLTVTLSNQTDLPGARWCRCCMRFQWG